MKTRITIRVRGYHADAFGHVNHARYLEFLEEARWSYCEENGISDRLFSEKRISHATVGITISYRKSAVPGDSLLIITGVSKRGERSYTMGQRIFLGETDALVVDAEVTCVLLDRAGAILQIDEEVMHIWPDLMDCPGTNPGKAY
jgi:thioesterase-3